MKRRIAVTATFVIGLYFFLEFMLPPFVGGGFDNTMMTDPCLVPTDQGVHLYYTGLRSREKAEESRLAIGLAESGDGMTWGKSAGNPVLARSMLSSKDWRGLGHPAVVREDDGSYTMFYVGHGADTVDRVMRATSADGERWERRGDVLNLSRSEYERTSITALTAARTAEGYVMYFSAKYIVDNRSISGISLATSPDGKAWTLHDGNPVLAIEPEGSWDYKTITSLSLLAGADDAYRLYYAGTKYVFGATSFPVTLIGLATSDDGVSWERHPGNPIFGPAVFRVLGGDDTVVRFAAEDVLDKEAVDDTALKRFDAMEISGVSVARVADGYLLAYGGIEQRGQSNARIGFAESNDGITWEPADAETALGFGSPSRSTYLTDAYVPVTNVFIVIGAMALGLGLVGLSTLHGGRIVRKDKDAAYSLGFFLSLIVSIVIIFTWESAGQATTGNKLYQIIRRGLIHSFGASGMGLLTFYLASAAHRSFKLKNAEAGLMMLAAMLIMLGQVPLGQLVTSWLPEDYQIQNVSTSLAYTIVLPVMRAIKIGAAVGGLVLATRLWFSMDRQRG